MTVQEIAWEFAGVFDELDPDQINEMLAKNVPLETLQFFTHLPALRRYRRSCGCRRASIDPGFRLPEAI